MDGINRGDKGRERRAYIADQALLRVRRSFDVSHGSLFLGQGQTLEVALGLANCACSLDDLSPAQSKELQKLRALLCAAIAEETGAQDLAFDLALQAHRAAKSGSEIFEWPSTAALLLAGVAATLLSYVPRH